MVFFQDGRKKTIRPVDSRIGAEKPPLVDEFPIYCSRRRRQTKVTMLVEKIIDHGLIFFRHD
jgi:hypothetical protein